MANTHVLRVEAISGTDPVVSPILEWDQQTKAQGGDAAIVDQRDDSPEGSCDAEFRQSVHQQTGQAARMRTSFRDSLAMIPLTAVEGGSCSRYSAGIRATAQMIANTCTRRGAT